MKNRFYYLVVSLLFTANFLISQNRKIDSLVKLINAGKEDTIKLDNLSKLGIELLGVGQFDTAIYYSKVSRDMSLRLEKINPKVKVTLRFINKTIGNSYNIAGTANLYKGNYDLSIQNFIECIKYFEIIDFKRGLASCKQNIGAIYYYKGNYSKTLENFLQASKLFESVGDDKGMADIEVNIGSNYRILGKTNLAYEHYNIALKKYQKINYKPGLAISYMNIGILQYDNNQLEESLRNQLLSMKIKKEINDKAGLAEGYCNVASVYAKQKKFTEAIDNYNTAIELQKQLQNKNGLSYCYNFIAGVYYELNQYKKSQEYFNLGLDIATEIGLKEVMRDSYLSLATISSKTNDFKSAYNYHQKYVQIKDTMFNQESNKKFAELSTFYESDKKEKELKLIKLQQENEKVIADKKSTFQKTIAISAILVAVLVLVFALFVYRTLRLTKTQKSIIEEKQREILDSIRYAKRIQTAQLPNEKFIEKNLDRLKKN